MNTPVITPKALYFTADRKTVVAQGDPRAAYLIANAGTQIPQGHLKALGLLDEVKPRVLTDDDLAALTAPDEAPAEVHPQAGSPRHKRIPRDPQSR